MEEALKQAQEEYLAVEQQRLEAQQEYLAAERRLSAVTGQREKRRKIFLDAKAAVDSAGGYQISPAHNLPAPLAEHVLEFIFNDPESLASWVQTCHRNRTLCLDKLTALKVFWEQLEGLRSKHRKQVFRVKLTGLKWLDLGGNDFAIDCGSLAAVLPQLTGLKELYLSRHNIGDAGAATFLAAWKKAGKDASELSLY